MSDILERAKQDFRNKLNKEMDYVVVPEWGESEDKPLLIYYRTSTLQEQDQIFKYQQEGTLKSLAQTLISRALNADGTKMFKPVHMTELMKHVDSDVIARICTEMGGNAESVSNVTNKESVEEAEKN